MVEPLLLVAVPLIPAAIHLSKFYLPIQIEIAAIGILISELLLIVLIYRLKIYDINDTAKQLMIRWMMPSSWLITITSTKKSMNRPLYCFRILPKPKDTGLAEISPDLDQILKERKKPVYAIVKAGSMSRGSERFVATARFGAL